MVGAGGCCVKTCGRKKPSSGVLRLFQGRLCCPDDSQKVDLRKNQMRLPVCPIKKKLAAAAMTAAFHAGAEGFGGFGKIGGTNSQVMFCVKTHSSSSSATVDSQHSSR